METASQTAPVLKAEHVSKHFLQGEVEITVLEHAQLDVAPGERVAVLGRSGSGKSTLMHVLAGLDTPDEGDVAVAGYALADLSGDQKAQLRARHMGFVYQNHHLLSEFTALENVMIPLRIVGANSKDAKDTAIEVLQKVGLAERLNHYPRQLSGGERQRVAVARAVATKPAIVLADEPTGNLDKHNAIQIMQLMVDLSESYNVAFLVVTHDTSMLDQFHRVLELDGGQLTPIAIQNDL